MIVWVFSLSNNLVVFIYFVMNFLQNDCDFLSCENMNNSADQQIRNIMFLATFLIQNSSVQRAFIRFQNFAIF